MYDNYKLKIYDINNIKIAKEFLKSYFVFFNYINKNNRLLRY